MVGYGGSSAGSYLADPTSPIPSHCASIVATSTLKVKTWKFEFIKQYSRGNLVHIIYTESETSNDIQTKQSNKYNT